jgi:glucose/arabinose dehydrogenase
MYPENALAKVVRTLSLVGLCLLAAAAGWSQIPTDIKFTKALGTNAISFKFENPVWLGEMPGAPGTFIVLEQRLQTSATTGRIQVVEKNGSGAWTKSVFLTLAVQSDGDENGLLGFAFHPQYATNHRYFLYRTLADNVQVEERKSDATFRKDSGDSAKILFTEYHNHTNHNGGCLAFGKDGYLYISIGENGQDTPAQDLTSLLGKVLRIDVDHADATLPYAIPATNPFAGNASDGIRKEIWAYGFRNPWRFSFDTLNGNLWLGDVGSAGSGRVEEINLVRAGRNYGWPCREGKQATGTGGACPNPIDPAEGFLNNLGWTSIIGGVIYRGKTNSRFYGKYIFAIYGEPSPVGAVDLTDTVSGGIIFNANDGPSQISHMTSDSQGRIYFTTRLPSGEIYMLDHPDLLPDSGTPPPQPPPAPTGLAITAGVGQVSLSWSPVAGAVAYRIYYRAGTTVAKANAAANLAGVSPQVIGPLSSDSNYAFVVTATDSVGESAVSAVMTAKPLAPLAIATPALPAGRSNSAYAATLQATGGTPPYTFAITAGSLPSGLALSGATLTGTPSQPGTFSITLEATDAAARKIAKAFNLILAVNRAPKITSPAAGKATEGSDYAYTAAASDSDGNSLAFTFREFPAWMSVAGAKVHGIPGASDTGASFWALVSDGQIKDSLRVTVQVVHANKAPILDSALSGADSLAEGDSALYRAVAHDPEGDELIFRWSLDSGASAAGTAAYRYRPGYSAAGKRTLTVRVEDSNGASAEHAFSVFVKNVPLPPVCLHAPGNVPSTDAFAFGWKTLRDPDLDSATVGFRMEAYQDSGLKTLVDAQDSLPGVLPLSSRNKLAAGGAVYVRVSARDARGVGTGFGQPSRFVFAPPVALSDPGVRARKLRAYRLATRPGQADLGDAGRSILLDAKGRRL